jgi:hypothetical protein
MNDEVMLKVEGRLRFCYKCICDKKNCWVCFVLVLVEDKQNSKCEGIDSGQL